MDNRSQLCALRTTTLGNHNCSYEGAPDYPDPGVWWKIVEKYGVTKFYPHQQPSEHLMRFGIRYTNLYNLDSLRILGTVGEPMNPEAGCVLQKRRARKKCP
jgi:acetyl-CoA synthetase